MADNPDSLIASGALLLSIPLGVLLFFLMRPERAALVTILGGLLFLPELVSFKFPLLPPLTKQTIPYLTALIGFLLRRPRTVWHLPRERWVSVVMLIIVADGIGIAMTNGDPLTYGVWRKVQLPGLTTKDGMFVAVSIIFQMGLPFFLGSVVIREVKDLEYLFRLIVKLGLIYSLFALLEIRLSPQLHYWVYGFYQHSFAQTFRFGGFRPTVFMAHGLTVALFFTVCVLAATTLARLRLRAVSWMGTKTPALLLGLILLLCKSTGAIVYAAVSAPLLFLGSIKLQQRIATFLVIVVLLYPSMRESDVFPTAAVLSLADMAGADREQSLAFRFNNENLLVKKARQHPWFGWGEYNRNEIFDNNAKTVTITDGQWIIALGIAGFTGFLSQFGLLVVPVFLAGRRLRESSDEYGRRLVAATSLIVAVTAVDLLPNSLGSNYPYFLSGALLSTSAALLRSARPAGPQTLVATADFINPLRAETAGTR